MYEAITTMSANHEVGAGDCQSGAVVVNVGPEAALLDRCPMVHVLPAVSAWLEVEVASVCPSQRSFMQ